MKHFLVDIHYTASDERILQIKPEHRKFLQIGYDRGLLLMSGPKVPPSGGLVVARAESLEEIQAFFQQDPYALEKAAEHSFTEFQPVKFNTMIADWLVDQA